MKPVRIGIVGVGQIGKAHLQQYSQMEGVELVAACDIDLPELDRVCNLHNIPNRYELFRDLLARDDLDAVDVCLHNNLHAPVTIEVLRSGKHAYCEKPIAGSYRDGLNMVETARQCGKMLHIQLFSLYTPDTRAARRLIDEGRLGYIYHARSTGFRRRNRPYVDGYGTDKFVRKEISGGGALFDMGIYHITQLLYLMDRPKMERVSGFTYQQTPMNEERRRFSNYSVEELGIGLVRFEGGRSMDIIESWAVHMDGFESGSLFGSLGGIRLQPFRYCSGACDMDLDSDINLERENLRWHRLNPGESAYDSSQQHWVAALRGEAPLLDTAGIALDAMLISEGIYMSQRLGREVAADEVRNLSQSTALVL